VICASCGTENRAGRKFCSSCGSPLAVACPSCGAANEPADRFCGECGTALGDAHFRLLARFARRAILSFDSDEAGARAAERAYQIHQAYPLEVRVLVLPDGLDPADFVRTRGSEAFVHAAARALPLIQFMLDRTLGQADLRSLDGRTRAATEAAPFLGTIQDPVAKEQYVHYVADRIGVSDAAVTAKLGGAPTRRGSDGTPADDNGALPKLTPPHRVEWEMLKLLARSDDIYDVYAPELGDEHFDRAQHRKLFQILRDRHGDVRAVVSELPPEDKLAGSLAALATDPLDGEPTREYADRVALRLKEFELKRRIDHVRKDLERLNPINDQPQYDTMFVELSKLEGARRRVREQAEPR